MQSAKALIAKIGSSHTPVKYCTDCSLSFEAQTIDVTTKETAEGASEEEVTTKSCTVTFKQYIDDEETTLPFKVGTIYAVSCAYDEDSAVSFSGLCTSVNESAPVSGKATRDVTIKSRGALTYA